MSLNKLSMKHVLLLILTLAVSFTAAEVAAEESVAGKVLARFEQGGNELKFSSFMVIRF